MAGRHPGNTHSNQRKGGSRGSDRKIVKRLDQVIRAQRGALEGRHEAGPKPAPIGTQKDRHKEENQGGLLAVRDARGMAHIQYESGGHHRQGVAQGRSPLPIPPFLRHQSLSSWPTASRRQAACLGLAGVKARGTSTETSRPTPGELKTKLEGGKLREHRERSLQNIRTVGGCQ